MKKFFEYSKLPIIVGITAAILYCIDSLIAPSISFGASFMWIAFLAWTLTSGLKLKEMFIIWLGLPIGFVFAVFMIYFSQTFELSLLNISIAGVIGTLIANFIMMYFSNLKDVWGKLLSGIFLGVALSFSGIGISLSPNTIENSFILLGTILLYCTFGMLCAFITSYLHSIWKRNSDLFNNNSIIKDNKSKQHENSNNKIK